MNRTDVTVDGPVHVQPGREALTGASWALPDHDGHGEGHPEPRRRSPAPAASEESYYGQPVLNRPTWEAREIAGYFFLGGLAGASSVLGAGAHLTGRRHLANRAKVGAAAAAGLSVVALVKDLGVPSRFPNMLRVIRPTSPMSVGSWLLAAYGPAAGVAAATSVTGRMPKVGMAATAAAAALGPAVASYTGVLVADTAVPAWHDGHREMPLLFAASGASAAAGLGMVVAPRREAAPARRLGLVATAAELVAEQALERGLDEQVGQAYHQGRAGTLLRGARALGVTGALLGATWGRRSRLAAAAAGASLLAASALTRFGVFEAGVASAEDPLATTRPQRARLER